MNKKILYVIPSLATGGTERHLLRIAKGLKNRGYNINVFCFGPTNTVGQKLIAEGITVHANQTDLYSTLKALYCLIRHEKPDFTHFFLPKAYILGVPVARLAGAKSLFMSRRSLNLYQQKHRFAGLVERCLHRWMKKISGNSKAVVNQLAQEEAVPENKLLLIYNGIEPQSPPEDFNRNNYRNQLGIEPNTLLLTIIANLIPYKGHQDLLKALGLLRDKLPNQWELLCVGRNDGIQDDLQAYAKTQDIHEHVRFLGARNDIIELLNISDIGLLVSHEEGFSNAILEKMSAGLPLVVTDVGGNAEAVIDQENGYVVAPRNPEELANAILTLAKDPPLRKKMGQANTKRVATYFTMAKCLDDYEAMYQAK